jgi:hypothetical protein
MESEVVQLPVALRSWHPRPSSKTSSDDMRVRLVGDVELARLRERRW